MTLSNTGMCIAVLAITIGVYNEEIRNFMRIKSTKGTSSLCMIDDAEKYTTDVMPVVGFHIICIQRQNVERLSGIAFLNGTKEQRDFECANDMKSLRNTLESILEIEAPTDEHAIAFKQSWGMFSTEGIRLTNFDVIKSKEFFVFEGGQFLWPGIKVGHQKIVQNVQSKGNITLETLSMSPLVFSVDNFLNDDEIELIQQLSLPHMANSGVVYLDGHEGRPATDWRTSTTYFLPSEHETIKKIDQRTQDLVRVPKSHQEDVQVLRYEKTQKYDAHTDYFPVELHSQNEEILESIQYGYKNRMITVFWYMTDVEEGGHTIFPMAEGRAPPQVMSDCTNGLKVKPEKRKAIVFYSLLPNGVPDPNSLHGGCPVIKGTKWAANKWVWNKPYSR